MNIRGESYRLKDRRTGADRGAARAPRKHLLIRNPEHHQGIPLGVRTERKIVVHLEQTALLRGGYDEPDCADEVL